VSRASSDRSRLESLSILVPDPGVYRVTYSEAGSSREIGLIWASASGADSFSVANSEQYIGRVEMRDFGQDRAFALTSWGIFFIVLGILAFILFCSGLLIFCKYRYFHRVINGNASDSAFPGIGNSDFSLSVVGESQFSLTVRQVESGPRIRGMRSGTEDGGAKAIKGNLKEEYGGLQTKMAIIRWGVFVAVRVLIMILILVIAHLGFVSLFYFTVLLIASFVLALFLNTLLDRDTLDLEVQIAMWLYFIPLLELMISLNLAVIQGFFSEVLSNLDFETITRALTMPTEAGHRFVVFHRWGWYFYYFGAMGSMFLICLIAPGSDLTSHVGSVFSFTGLIVPLSAAVRPILGAWAILLFDRTNLEIPET
jgi:hypothetical protein